MCILGIILNTFSRLRSLWLCAQLRTAEVQRSLASLETSRSLRSATTGLLHVPWPRFCVWSKWCFLVKQIVIISNKNIIFFVFYFCFCFLFLLLFFLFVFYFCLFFIFVFYFCFCFCVFWEGRFGRALGWVAKGL